MLQGSVWWSRALVGTSLMFAIGNVFAEANAADRSSAVGELPNIIIILADDLGYNDISLNGNPLVATPNIDDIARSGARFTNGYAAHSTCSPSRAALLTGRFAQRFGYEFVRTSDSFVKAFDGTYATEEEVQIKDVPPRLPEDRAGLPPEETTIAEVLKELGYRTGVVGKWHLGSGRSRWPQTQGFDEFAGFPGGSSMYSPADDDWSIEARLPWSGIDQYLWDRLQFSIIEDGARVVPDKYMTDVLADHAIRFVNDARDDPFFLYLAFNAPHTPLDAPQDIYDNLAHIKDHKTRVYYAMVQSMDAAIGRVLQALTDAGKRDNTVVLFTSDNGGAWYTHIPIHNLPFRGWKSTFFEGGIKVPFAVSWPARMPGGQVISGPVSAIDLLPTLAELTGAKLPDDRAMDGVSLLSALLSGKPVPERTLYWSSGEYRAIRSGDWKLQTQADPKKRWLFNLTEDPTEQVNLADSLPTKVQQLEQQLDALHGQMMPPLWPPPYRYKMRTGPHVTPSNANQEWVWSN